MRNGMCQQLGTSETTETINKFVVCHVGHAKNVKVYTTQFQFPLTHFVLCEENLCFTAQKF